jgi:hypothetical protein
MHLNLEDEVVRSSIVSLAFEIAGHIEPSYDDYEHLLGEKRQLISQVSGEAQEEIEMQDFPMATEDDKQLEVIIKTFSEQLVVRPLSEYCKPFSHEQLTADYDDVCALAVAVARKLIGTRLDLFQLRMVETISDVMQPLETQEKQRQQ